MASKKKKEKKISRRRKTEIEEKTGVLREQARKMQLAYEGLPDC